MGKPGSDIELFEVLDSLHRVGVVSDVLAGPRMYRHQDTEDDLSGLKEISIS